MSAFDPKRTSMGYDTLSRIAAFKPTKLEALYGAAGRLMVVPSAFYQLKRLPEGFPERSGIVPGNW
jgi:hypothetical protein